MAKKPELPQVGQPVQAKTIIELIRWVQSLIPHGDNKTIKITQNDGGCTFTSIASSGSKLVPAKLKTYINYNTYIGDIYEDGLDQAATETNVYVRILIISSGEVISGLNTDSAVFPSWKQSWPKIGGMGRAEYYTCQPEIVRS